MEKLPNTQTSDRKAYTKPSWEKQEIFERFTLACVAKGAKSASPCINLNS